MYDLVVLGGGSGGLSLATMAARVGAKVAVVEQKQLGGACTHTACVPSKALIRAARLAHEVRSAGRFGIKTAAPEVDFAAVMARVRAVVAEFAGSGEGDSLKALGIDVFHGSPAFEAYDTVVIDGQTRLNAQRFVVATGSRPAVPKVEGLHEAGFLTSATVWDLDERPETIIIIGGGPVGVEFAQAFARIGSQVKLLTDDTHILPREDPEVSDRLAALLAAKGITIKTGVEITQVFARDGRKVVAFKDKTNNDTFEAAGSHILVAAGRLANVDGLNLHLVGIHADPHEGIEVDEYLQTRSQRVYAIGDVLARHEFTHAAELEAGVVFQNAVMRLPKKVDYSALPWATFTDPEVATVGLTEERARSLHPEVRVFRGDYADLDRAKIDGQTEGFAKVVATPGGKILGATIIGEDASLILQEFVLAMAHGLTLADIASTVHTYPTYGALARSLANQYVATRQQGGLLQTALRWLYGYQPRTAANGGAGEAQTTPAAEPAGHGHGGGH